MTAYRRMVLLLGTAGLLATAMAGVLSWVSTVGAGMALLALAWSVPRRAVAGAGGALLLVGLPLVPLTPPTVVAAGLTAVLLTAGARKPVQQELDAAAVGAVGLAVVAASATVDRGPAGPLAVCALLIVALLWHRQRAGVDHPQRRPQARVPTGLLAVAAGVLGLGLLATPAPASAGLHSSLFGRHGGGDRAGSGPIDPATYSTETLSLDVRGTLSTEPVLAVTADAPTLWRGTVYSSYDGHSWRVPTGLSAAGGGTGRITVTPAGLDPVPPTPAVTLAATPLSAVSGGTLYAPGVVTGLRTTGLFTPASPGAARVATDGGQPAPYLVTVHEPVSDPARLATAVGVDPDGWTQLPSAVPARVRALAADVTAGARNRQAAVAAVESYLRSHERYTLDAPVPAADQDSVDAFLFGSHEGFCEQFASAEVVLLRSVGIPARLATGFSEGRPDGERRVFAAADAHAWVEVAYRGLGWSESDPTAGAPLVAARSGLTAQLSAAVSRLGHSPLLRLATAGVLAAVALVISALWLLGRRGTAARRRRRAQAPVTAAFARLERRLPRAPGTTPREWLAGVPALTPAVVVWERELFAPTQPSAAEAQVAVALVRANRPATSPRSRRRP